ncbi:MAG: hypothetical protein AB7T74_16890 [Clostridia bacterium]|jgi:hypothetical protein|nr:hypothetical protein [Spirochaetia bacterium]
MPRGDGTGPAGGGGPGTGRGGGAGGGRGTMTGGGRGRNSGGAFGPGGYCICLGCNTRIAHNPGVSCTDLKCPNCGRPMIREELYNERKKN